MYQIPKLHAKQLISAYGKDLAFKIASRIAAGNATGSKGSHYWRVMQIIKEA